MNRNQLLLISIAGASLLAIAGSQMVWSKGHVPGHKVQMCHLDEVIQVGASAMMAHVQHGDIQLPACDFNNVRVVGGSCIGFFDTTGNGIADMFPVTPNRADGMTPACPGDVF